MPKEPSQSDKLCFDPKGGIKRLIEIMRRLRDRDHGCPWDIEQTFETIAPYTIEEAYEVADAIAQQDVDALEGELGDLLLQVIYHAQIGSEQGQFDFDSIANRISDKMVARHPHVFGDDSRDKTAAQQVADWEAIKTKERGDVGVLDGVAMNLPALTRALKLQKRAARVGFDWPNFTGIRAKMNEELDEWDDAISQGDTDHIAEEFGDLLFALVNGARYFDIDPEQALIAANRKFTTRFQYIENNLKKQGIAPENASLEQMESLWQQAKTAAKK